MGTRLLIAVALVLALAACKESQRRNAGGSGQAHPIAMINNERLTLEEFQNGYQLFLTRWDRFILNDKGKKQEIKEIILANMIDELLMDQEARRKGIVISQELLNKEIEEMTTPWNEGDLKSEVQEQKLSYENWRKQVHQKLIHKELVRREVVSKIRVTNREMQAYYEKNQKEFIQPEQVWVRHLAVNSTRQFDRAVRSIRRHGDFAKVAREYSITPDRLNGGDLGYVSRGVLPDEFDQVIFKMKRVGTLSSTTKPVKTQIGYHLFQLEGYKPRTVLSFSAARNKIREILVQQKQPRVFKTWLQTLRDKANIKIDKKLLEADIG